MLVVVLTYLRWRHNTSRPLFDVPVLWRVQVVGYDVSIGERNKSVQFEGSSGRVGSTTYVTHGNNLIMKILLQNNYSCRQLAQEVVHLKVFDFFLIRIKIQSSKKLYPCRIKSIDCWYARQYPIGGKYQWEEIMAFLYSKKLKQLK